MKFETPLVPGRLIRRYMRFLADVELDDGRVVKCHCPNPGSMMGLKTPGTRVWLEPNDDPKKKLDWGWRLVEQGGAFIVVDTAQANRVVGAALHAGQIPELAGDGDVRAEVKYGQNSRVDFLLGGRTYVEVKSVTLSRRPGLAEFPDSVTKRGSKHLDELAAMAGAGHRAVMLYLLQRTDCTRATVAHDIDPAYAAGVARAQAAGVDMLCYTADISPQGITLTDAVPFALETGGKPD